MEERAGRRKKLRTDAAQTLPCGSVTPRAVLSEHCRDGAGGVARVQRPRRFLFLVIAEETQ